VLTNTEYFTFGQVRAIEERFRNREFSTKMNLSGFWRLLQKPKQNVEHMQPPVKTRYSSATFYTTYS